jgi:hypothetical protein
MPMKTPSVAIVCTLLLTSSLAAADAQARKEAQTVPHAPFGIDWKWTPKQFADFCVQQGGVDQSSVVGDNISLRCRTAETRAGTENGPRLLTEYVGAIVQNGRIEGILRDRTCIGDCQAGWITSTVAPLASAARINYGEPVRAGEMAPGKTFTLWHMTKWNYAIIVESPVGGAIVVQELFALPPKTR